LRLSELVIQAGARLGIADRAQPHRPDLRTVGQTEGGEFGLVGLDGRFRSFAVGIVDGCGLIRQNAASLIGAAVFDAPRPRTCGLLFDGIGGPELRRVTIEAAGRTRTIAVGEGRSFRRCFPWISEDLGIRVGLRFAGRAC